MELETQINNIHHNITEQYDENYSNQIIQSIYNIKDIADINDIHNIVDIIESAVNDDHKQLQINNLQKNVNKLKTDNKVKDVRIKELEIDNIKLKDQVITLTNKVNELENDKNKFNALVKLNELNALVNKEFKNLYKKKFKKGRGDYIPNIGDYINEPPTEDEKDEYEFWLEFNSLYPGSNDMNFRNIYHQIANDRACSGAHINVKKLNKEDFNNLIEVAYPEEYNKNKELYNAYRDWLFMFPA